MATGCGSAHRQAEPPSQRVSSASSPPPGRRNAFRHLERQRTVSRTLARRAARFIGTVCGQHAQEHHSGSPPRHRRGSCPEKAYRARYDEASTCGPLPDSSTCVHPGVSWKCASRHWCASDRKEGVMPQTPSSYVAPRLRGAGSEPVGRRSLALRDCPQPQGAELLHQVARAMQVKSIALALRPREATAAKHRQTRLHIRSPRRRSLRCRPTCRQSFDAAMAQGMSSSVMVGQRGPAPQRPPARLDQRLTRTGRAAQHLEAT